MARWGELPVTVSMLESVSVHIVHSVHVKLTAKDQVVMHGFSGNFSNFALGKLQKCVAS